MIEMVLKRPPFWNSLDVSIVSMELTGSLLQFKKQTVLWEWQQSMSDWDLVIPSTPILICNLWPFWFFSGEWGLCYSSTSLWHAFLEIDTEWIWILVQKEVNYPSILRHLWIIQNCPHVIRKTLVQAITIDQRPLSTRFHGASWWMPSIWIDLSSKNVLEILIT